MSLIDSITFPLAANGPFLPVASKAKPGTYDEAVAAGGLDRGGFTSPYAVSGVNLGEVFAGAMMQEVWEAGLQQVYQALTIALVAVLGVALGCVIGFSLYLLGGAVLVAVVGAIVSGQQQTGGSEVQSHSISRLAAMQYDGVTEARARQQFVDNLSAYGYSSLAGMSEPQLYDAVVACAPYAQKWLSRPVNQARAAAFRKQVTDQPRDVQTAQQVAL